MLSHVLKLNWSSLWLWSFFKNLALLSNNQSLSTSINKKMIIINDNERKSTLGQETSNFYYINKTR